MCAPTFVLSLMQTCHGQHDQGVSLRPCNDVVNLGAETLSFGFGKADLNPFCSQGSLQLDISTQEDFSVCVWGGGWKYDHNGNICIFPFARETCSTWGLEVTSV